MDMSIPSLTGYTSTYANVGKTKGWGVDFQLNTVNIMTKDFQWTTNITYSMDRSEISELANGVKEDLNNGWFVGKQIGIAGYDYVYDGIWKTSEAAEAAKYNRKPGQIKVKDLDGDGRVDELTDRTYIGTADPDFFGGITFDFKYRNFDLNMFFQGVFGNQVSNDWKRQSDFWHISGSVPVGKNHPTRLLDAWSFDNPDSDIPAMTNVMTNNEQRMSTYYIEDGSYLKLRNIELGYTFPAKITNKMMMKNLRVYASARNVFTLKKFWGDDQFTSFDPEMSGYGYLTPFTMTFGLNVTF